MAATTTTQLQEAVTAIKAGKRQVAGRLLKEILVADHQNAQAWFLLSYVVETAQQKIACLERVLKLDPAHQEAQKRLSILDPATYSRVDQVRTRPKEPTVSPGQTREPEHAALPPNVGAAAAEPPHLRLDDVVEQWLSGLSYTERKLLDYLYLDANRFSVDAVGRIMGIPVEKVNEINQRVFVKLKEESAYQFARPLVTMVLDTLQRAGKSISQSQLDTELRRKLIVQRLDPLGVSRLILAIEKHRSSSKAEQRNAYSSAPLAPSATVTLKEDSTWTAPRRSEENAATTPDQSDSSAAEFTPWLEDDTSIAALSLSKRSFNALCRAGIITIGELIAYFPQRIWFVKNIGQKSIQEIEEQLRIYIAANPPQPIIQKVAPSGIASPPTKETEPPQQPSLAANPRTATEHSVEVAAYNEKFLPLTRDKSPLSVLKLERRTYNAICRAGIRTVAQLVSHSPEQLWDIRNIGEKAIREIETRLEAYLTEYTPLPELEIQSDPNPQPKSNFQPEKSEPFVLPSAVDPQILDQLATAPLHQINIERLGLSEILCRGLNRQGVKSIEQLIQHLAFLRDDGTIGKPLEHYLTWLAEQDELVWANEVAGKGISPLSYIQLSKTSIEELLEQWISILPERSREVLALRFGLREKSLTLQEVGDRIDLTRERARQIEKKALKTLQNHHRGPRNELLRPFLAFLHQSFVEQGGLLSEPEIIALLEDDRQIRLGNTDPLSVFLLVSEVDQRFKFYRRLQLAALTIYPIETISDVQQTFRSILLEKLTAVSETALLEEFKQTVVYEARRAEFPEEFFLACLRVHSNIERPEPGVYALSKWSNKRLDEVIMALRQLGQPSHYSLIAEKANELLSPEQQTTAHNVHAQMGRLTDIFVRVGHGIFGLAEWGLHDDGKVANAAYRVLKEARKPLHVDVITQEVLKTWHVQPGSVYAAIQNDDRLIGIGSGVYYIREFANETSLPQTDFGTLYGDKLARWQIELNRQSENVGIDTQSEIDAIRNIGLDFFVN